MRRLRKSARSDAGNCCDASPRVRDVGRRESLTVVASDSSRREASRARWRFFISSANENATSLLWFSNIVGSSAFFSGVLTTLRTTVIGLRTTDDFRSFLPLSTALTVLLMVATDNVPFLDALVFASDFLSAGFFSTGFFAADAFATGFFAAGFFAADAFATGFFAAGCFAADAFAAGFLAAGFFATGFLAAGFLAVLVLKVNLRFYDRD